MKRIVLFAMLLAIAAAAAVSGSLQAAQGSTSSHIAGVVPPIGAQVSGTGDLLYHGGPVMLTNKTYAIYWVPQGYSVGSGYTSTINQYFGDVAHDSGMGTNVYAVATQYSSIQYNSAVGGSVTDTNAFPSSGCPLYEGDITKCLTDAQIITEIDNVINARGWTRNATNMFFMFTPIGVGSCFSSGGGSCAYTAYCAYHGFTGSGAIYANQPYAKHSGCDAGQYPNGNDSDPTINVVSHEHMEAITDPKVNVDSAWYDQAGYEIGDKCAWDFGAVSGPNGAEYNQTINTHHYFLQREYSNNGHACLQTYNIQGGGGVPSVSFFFPGRGRAGTTVILQGKHFTGTTKVTIHGASATYTVNSDTKITTRVPISAPPGYGKWQVTNPSGTGTSTNSFYVG
jgi:hypothetical protein